MSYEVMKGTLCEAYEFDTLGAFLYVDFFRGLSRNCIPRRCRSCGSWFLIPGGKYTQYLETNYPETKEYPAKNPEQEKTMHETERDIAERLTMIWTDCDFI